MTDTVSARSRPHQHQHASSTPHMSTASHARHTTVSNVVNEEGSMGGRRSLLSRTRPATATARPGPAFNLSSRTPTVTSARRSSRPMSARATSAVATSDSVHASASQTSSRRSGQTLLLSARSSASSPVAVGSLAALIEWHQQSQRQRSTSGIARSRSSNPYSHSHSHSHPLSQHSRTQSSPPISTITDARATPEIGSTGQGSAVEHVATVHVHGDEQSRSRQLTLKDLDENDDNDDASNAIRVRDDDGESMAKHDVNSLLSSLLLSGAIPSISSHPIPASVIISSGGGIFSHRPDEPPITIMSNQHPLLDAQLSSARPSSSSASPLLGSSPFRFQRFKPMESKTDAVLQKRQSRTETAWRQYKDYSASNYVRAGSAEEDATIYDGAHAHNTVQLTTRPSTSNTSRHEKAVKHPTDVGRRDMPPATHAALRRHEEEKQPMVSPSPLPSSPSSSSAAGTLTSTSSSTPFPIEVSCRPRSQSFQDSALRQALLGTSFKTNAFKVKLRPNFMGRQNNKTMKNQRATYGANEAARDSQGGASASQRRSTIHLHPFASNEPFFASSDDSKQRGHSNAESATPLWRRNDNDAEPASNDSPEATESIAAAIGAAIPALMQPGQTSSNDSAPHADVQVVEHTILSSGGTQAEGQPQQQLEQEYQLSPHEAASSALTQSASSIQASNGLRTTSSSTAFTSSTDDGRAGLTSSTAPSMAFSTHKGAFPIRPLSARFRHAASASTHIRTSGERHAINTTRQHPSSSSSSHAHAACSASTSRPISARQQATSGRKKRTRPSTAAAARPATVRGPAGFALVRPASASASFRTLNAHHGSNHPRDIDAPLTIDSGPGPNSGSGSGSGSGIRLVRSVLFNALPSTQTSVYPNLTHHVNEATLFKGMWTPASIITSAYCQTTTDSDTHRKNDTMDGWMDEC